MKKALRLFAALVAVLAVFTGCTGAGAPESQSSESVSEPETKKIPDSPLQISTPGGAVLIGEIGHDADGWRFTAERPIDLSLTYYEGDTPETFDGVTMFRMLDTDGDGVNKALYDGMTVTVFGLISNPRGAGVLYLIPYRVERGKAAAQSCAAPELQAPDAMMPMGYDAAALPSEMALAIDGESYSYNYYLLSEEALNLLGNTFAALYVDFVNAYLRYETSIVCPILPPMQGGEAEIHLGEYLQSVVSYEFPVFEADAEFVGYDRETRTLRWKYSTEKPQHDAITAEFKTLAEQYLKGVKPTDGEQLRAQKVYRNFTPAMSYDYAEAEKTVRNITAYAVFKQKRGICSSFATAYAVLLTQVGVKCTIAGGVYGSEPHTWNVITADGVNYFADPTFELSGGASYRYFGEGYQSRINDGIEDGSIYIGRYGSVDAKGYGISEQDLKALPIA